MNDQLKADIKELSFAAGIADTFHGRNCCAALDRVEEALTHAIEHMKRGHGNFDRHFSCPNDTMKIQVCKFDNEKTFQVRALSYSKGWANCMEISSNTEDIGTGNECLYKAAPEPPQERKD